MSLVWWHMPAITVHSSRMSVRSAWGTALKNKQEQQKPALLNLGVFKQRRLSKGSNAFVEQSPLTQAESKVRQATFELTGQRTSYREQSNRPRGKKSLPGYIVFCGLE